MSDILKQMSRKEKIGLCTGADLWHSRAYPKLGIRRLTVSDGPHGIRFQPSGESMAGVHQAEPVVFRQLPRSAAAGILSSSVGLEWRLGRKRAILVWMLFWRRG